MDAGEKMDMSDGDKNTKEAEIKGRFKAGVSIQ
jgi:hypothetical protein